MSRLDDLINAFGEASETSLPTATEDAPVLRHDILTAEILVGFCVDFATYLECANWCYVDIDGTESNNPIVMVPDGGGNEVYCKVRFKRPVPAQSTMFELCEVHLFAVSLGSGEVSLSTSADERKATLATVTPGHVLWGSAFELLLARLKDMAHDLYRARLRAGMN